MPLTISTNQSRVNQAVHFDIGNIKTSNFNEIMLSRRVHSGSVVRDQTTTTTTIKYGKQNGLSLKCFFINTGESEWHPDL